MGLKHLLLSVIGIAVTAAVIATIVSERNNPSGSDILIPTLNLSVAPKPGTSLLGALYQGIPVNDYTSGESLEGVVIRKDEHNLVSCPQGSMPNIPVTATSGNFQIPAGTLFWGYQYSGRENANYSAGKTKLNLFDGTFYLSQAQVNDADTVDLQNLYVQINKLTKLDSTGSGKQLYFMSAIDLCFSCGAGLQTAAACPTHGAASSSSLSLSSSSSSLSSALSSSASSVSSSASSSSSSSSSASSISSSSSSSSSFSVNPPLSSSSSSVPPVACSSPAQCSSGQGCVNGVCGPCSSTTQCSAGQACVNNVCGPCSTNSQCANGQFCSNNTCVDGCGTNPPCLNGQTCVSGSCENNCGTGGPCGQNQACINNVCIDNCGANPPCPTGSTCIQNTACVANCGANPPCPTGQGCLNNTCVNDCGPNPPCGTGQQCVSGICQGNCGSNPPCSSGQTCVSGTCQDNCGSNLPCATNQACVSGTCQNNCGNNPPCAANQQCVSGSCQNNCGSNPPCSSTQLCVSGSCVPTCANTPSPCGTNQICTDTANGATCRDRTCLDNINVCPADKQICKVINSIPTCINCGDDPAACPSGQQCILNGSLFQCVPTSNSSSSVAQTIRLTIDFPRQYVSIGQTFTIQYHTAGNNTQAHHVQFKVGTSAEQSSPDLSGTFTFQNAPVLANTTQLLTAYVATANGIEIAGSRVQIPVYIISGNSSSVGTSLQDVYLGGPYCGIAYWTNPATNEIRRANMDGTSFIVPPTAQFNTQRILQTPAPKQMYLDAFGGKIYFSTSADNSIRRINLDGTGLETIIANAGVAEAVITLDPDDGKIIWFAGSAPGPTLYSADMNGANQKSLTTGVGSVYAYDATNNQVFGWTTVGIPRYVKKQSILLQTNTVGPVTNIMSLPTTLTFIISMKAFPTDGFGNGTLYVLARDSAAIGQFFSMPFSSSGPATATISNLPVYPVNFDVDVPNQKLYYLYRKTISGTYQLVVLRMDLNGSHTEDVLYQTTTSSFTNTSFLADVRSAGVCPVASSSSSSLPQGAVCGNGVVENGEQCDDGNTNDRDACFSNCRWVVPPNILP